MSYKGMTGCMGYSSNEHPITIELIKLWNELGILDGFIHSYEDKMPEHLSKLNEAINSVGEYLKNNPAPHSIG